jgi:hypothetical protein
MKTRIPPFYALRLLKRSALSCGLGRDALLAEASRCVDQIRAERQAFAGQMARVQSLVRPIDNLRRGVGKLASFLGPIAMLGVPLFLIAREMRRGVNAPPGSERPYQGPRRGLRLLRRLSRLWEGYAIARAVLKGWQNLQGFRVGPS